MSSSVSSVLSGSLVSRPIAESIGARSIHPSKKTCRYEPPADIPTKTLPDLKTLCGVTTPDTQETHEEFGRFVLEQMQQYKNSGNTFPETEIGVTELVQTCFHLYKYFKTHKPQPTDPTVWSRPKRGEYVAHYNQVNLVNAQGREVSGDADKTQTAWSSFFKDCLEYMFKRNPALKNILLQEGLSVTSFASSRATSRATSRAPSPAADSSVAPAAAPALPSDNLVGGGTAGASDSPPALGTGLPPIVEGADSNLGVVAPVTDSDILPVPPVVAVPLATREAQDAIWAPLSGDVERGVPSNASDTTGTDVIEGTPADAQPLTVVQSETTSYSPIRPAPTFGGPGSTLEYEPWTDPRSQPHAQASTPDTYRPWRLGDGGPPPPPPSGHVGRFSHPQTSSGHEPYLAFYTQLPSPPLGYDPNAVPPPPPPIPAGTLLPGAVTANRSLTDLSSALSVVRGGTSAQPSVGTPEHNKMVFFQHLHHRLTQAIPNATIHLVQPVNEHSVSPVDTQNMKPDTPYRLDITFPGHRIQIDFVLDSTSPMAQGSSSNLQVTSVMFDNVQSAEYNKKYTNANELFECIYPVIHEAINSSHPAVAAPNTSLRRHAPLSVARQDRSSGHSQQVKRAFVQELSQGLMRLERQQHAPNLPPKLSVMNEHGQPVPQPMDQRTDFEEGKLYQLDLSLNSKSVRVRFLFNQNELNVSHIYISGKPIDFDFVGMKVSDHSFSANRIVNWIAPHVQPLVLNYSDPSLSPMPTHSPLRPVPSMIAPQSASPFLTPHLPGMWVPQSTPSLFLTPGSQLRRTQIAPSTSSHLLTTLKAHLRVHGEFSDLSCFEDHGNRYTVCSEEGQSIGQPYRLQFTQNGRWLFVHYEWVRGEHGLAMKISKTSTTHGNEVQWGRQSVYSLSQLVDAVGRIHELSNGDGEYRETYRFITPPLGRNGRVPDDGIERALKQQGIIPPSARVMCDWGASEWSQMPSPPYQFGVPSMQHVRRYHPEIIAETYAQGQWFQKRFRWDAERNLLTVISNTRMPRRVA